MKLWRCCRAVYFRVLPPLSSPLGLRVLWEKLPQFKWMPSLLALPQFAELLLVATEMHMPSLKKIVLPLRWYIPFCPFSFVTVACFGCHRVSFSLQELNICSYHKTSKQAANTSRLINKLSLLSPVNKGKSGIFRHIGVTCFKWGLKQ